MRAIVDGGAGNNLETAVPENRYANEQVNHLGLRTCDWTKRLKSLATGAFATAFMHHASCKLQQSLH